VEERDDMTDLYSFRITFRGDLGDPEQVVDVLYGSGCDDATVSVERDGSVGYADFDRDADDALTAVVTAVEQVEAAGLDVLSIGDDLVSVADIAERTGRSQQTVSAWINKVRGPGGFPAGRVDRHWGAVYSWAEVADWLSRHNLADIDPAAAEIAAACAAVSALLDARARLRVLPPPAARRARRLLAA
jgi:hypothetical protein